MTVVERFRQPLNVIASEAKQSSAARAAKQDWIASSQGLLAMTVVEQFR